MTEERDYECMKFMICVKQTALHMHIISCVMCVYIYIYVCMYVCTYLNYTFRHTVFIYIHTQYVSVYIYIIHIYIYIHISADPCRQQGEGVREEGTRWSKKIESTEKSKRQEARASKTWKSKRRSQRFGGLGVAGIGPSFSGMMFRCGKANVLEA